MGHLLCIGYGYCAAELAKHARAHGFEVTGTSRNAKKPLVSYVVGESTTALQKALLNATHLLISTPPQSAEISALTDLAYCNAPSLQWLGYCSTTGVYGDYQGAWVDENATLHATEPRSLWRIADEERVKKLWPNHHYTKHVFRLAGIYGPGRSAIESVLHGTAKRIEKPGQFFSRVHVSDIAQTLWQAMQYTSDYELFNVADDTPTPPAEPVTYACELLGVTPPPLQPYEAANVSPTMRSFYMASRKIKNEKIKSMLGVSLQFPSYREGLRTIYAALPTSPAAKA